MRRYRLGFVWQGTALFALVMLPNILWEVFLSGDVLHRPSATPGLDMAMAVCQWLFVAALCLMKNRGAGRLTPKGLMGPAGALALYWGCWALYFGGVTGWPVLLGLTVFPCAAFLLFAVERRNWIAFIPAACFSVLHLFHFWSNYMT